MTEPTVPFWAMAVLVTVQAGLAFAIVNGATAHVPELSLYVMGTVQVMLTALTGVLHIAKRPPVTP